MTTTELKKWLEDHNVIRPNGLNKKTKLILTPEIKQELGPDPIKAIYDLYNPGNHTCSVCGKETPFINYRYGYSETCSKECHYKLVESRKQNTKKEKYGNPTYNNPIQQKTTKKNKKEDPLKNKEIKKLRELCIIRGFDYKLGNPIIINGKPYTHCNRETLNDIFDYDGLVEQVFQNTKEFPVYKYNNPTGLNLIRQYHPSIYKCHLKGKLSPYEAWYNDDLRRKCIENRVIYSRSLAPNAIVNGFNVNKIAPKISIFSPTLAERLVKTYLPYDTVFDPFSGYSGRMLGVTKLKKKYIGQDINPVTVEESNNIIKDYKLNAEVTCKDVMDSYGEYDCLFTCSPYEDKEIWEDNLQIRTCDEWIDICLEHFKCKTYLFVADGTEKYKDYIVEELKNKSHFGSNKEYVIKIGL